MEMLYCDIKFEAKKAIKSQALADFIAEWVEQQQPTHIYSAHWTMFFDGSKMLNGSGAGVVIISPKGDKLKYMCRYTLIPPTTRQSMKLSFMDCAWPSHSASVA